MGRAILWSTLGLTLLLLISLWCGNAAESTPPPEAEPVETDGAAEPTVAHPPTATPIVEERTVELEWPAAMRAGDSDVIRLSLIPEPGAGYVAQPEIEGHEVEEGEIAVPVARPGYTGYAQASLSAAGLEVQPASPEKQPLAPGKPNTWRWTISPERPGSYRVVADLTLRWEPEPGTNLPGPLEEPVWSDIASIEARATLGLSGRQVDWMSAGGSALGLVSGVPFAEKVLERLWKWVKDRRGGAGATGERGEKEEGGAGRGAGDGA